MSKRQFFWSVLELTIALLILLPAGYMLIPLGVQGFLHFAAHASMELFLVAIAVIALMMSRFLPLRQHEDQE